MSTRKLTGRDLRDLTLTIREMAQLPWRVTQTDPAGKPTQVRATATIDGLSMVVVQDITYYASNHPSRPNMVDKITYTITGPDVDDNQNPTVKVVELTVVYSGSNVIGEDVDVDGVSWPYTP